MLSLSENEVIFKTGEMLKSITIKNLSKDLSLIFKIRTNKIDYVDSKPNMGIIPKQKVIQLLIKALKGSSFEAKLQISYAVLQQQAYITGSNSLSAQWTKIPKEKIQSMVLTVKKEQSFQSESRETVTSQQFLTNRSDTKRQSIKPHIEVGKKVQTKPLQAHPKEQSKENFKSMAQPQIQENKQNPFPQIKKQQLKPAIIQKQEKQVQVKYIRPSSTTTKKQQKKPKQPQVVQKSDSPFMIKINIFKLIGLLLITFIIGHLHGRNNVVCSPVQIIASKTQENTVDKPKNSSKQL